MKGAWDADRDPLAALRDGNPGPFEAFVAAESATFLAFFLRLGALRPEAEDLTQELFLKLFRHAPHYQARDRFSAYSFRVARNAWIDRQRRSAVRPAPAGGDVGEQAFEQRVAVDPREPLERVVAEEEAQRLTRALAALSEAHRMVFELGVVQERPYAEIAETLGIPVGTVKSRMYHAVRKLRAELEPAPERPLGSISEDRA